MNTLLFKQKPVTSTSLKMCTTTPADVTTGKAMTSSTGESTTEPANSMTVNVIPVKNATKGSLRQGVTDSASLTSDENLLE